ncbi:hypothetical protein NP233_g10935 [Leucocoprinus birnbaumii]|uniref:Uncharacterized protein n=1 Tax=Leucocoprinus birnbaumii TaxID=56174 RepID=A0AAD5VND3_9AGAR|nr:hypothetical protein NP233_g10935 [Leucocoprinus birnbaumii]
MKNLQSDWENILIAYNVLSIFSVLLIIVTLLPPLLSRSVHRRLPWYSHMLSWLVFSAALLVLMGHQTDKKPPAELCFLQSALLYATPPLIAFSMACYLLDITLQVATLLDKKSLLRKSLLEKKFGISVILGLLPWVIFWAVIIEVSIVFATANDMFKPSGDLEIHLFCHYNSKST